MVQPSIQLQKKQPEFPLLYTTLSPSPVQRVILIYYPKHAFSQVYLIPMTVDAIYIYLIVQVKSLGVILHLSLSLISHI